MRFEGRKVYLTGATGFIGGVIARKLRDEGAELTCLVRPRTPAAALEAMGAHVARGDITDPDTLDMSGHAIVIHAAAWVGFGIPQRKLELFRATNITGTQNIVDAAIRDGVGKLVHVSSIAALGRHGAAPITEDVARPATYLSEYERTKTEAHAVVAKSSIAHTIPMPGLVIGADGPFRPILQSLARGRVPALPGDDAVKGWVHVEDAAEGILQCALKGRDAYLLVDENVRTTELFVAALEEAGLRVPRMRVPTKLLLGAAGAIEFGYRLARRSAPISRELLDGLAVPMSYDSSKARKELGWRPMLVKRLAADLALLSHG